MGLPGSGKTTLAEKLFEEICKNYPSEWLNADEVRKECDDWDFTPEGRKRQASRMRLLADKFVAAGFVTVCDFVCPTENYVVFSMLILQYGWTRYTKVDIPILTVYLSPPQKKNMI